jgi:hypothetical protein
MGCAFLQGATTNQQKERRSGSMKLQNIVRMALMGLGAALLLAGSAYAQQDMDPTDFPINPGTPVVERAAVPPVAQAVAKSEDAKTAVPTTLWSESTQESDFARMMVVDGTMLLILLAGVSSIALYAIAATKRDRLLQPVLQDGPYPPASGVTTH